MFLEKFSVIWTLRLTSGEILLLQVLASDGDTLLDVTKGLLATVFHRVFDTKAEDTHVAQGKLQLDQTLA